MPTPTGATFYGKSVNGLKEGRGEMRYDWGDRYVGEFRGDQYNGYG
jgi:hypothetical protein